MTKNVCVSWNDYGETYKYMLNNFRHKNLLTDVTLACEDKTFVAHKLVLVTCSEFFKSLLEDNKCSHPIIYLGGISGSDMETLINFMYLGTIDIPSYEIESLLSTADTLKIKGLKFIKQEDQSDNLVQIIGNKSSNVEMHDNHCVTDSSLQGAINLTMSDSKLQDQQQPAYSLMYKLPPTDTNMISEVQHKGNFEISLQRQNDTFLEQCLSRQLFSSPAVAFDKHSMKSNLSSDSIETMTLNDGASNIFPANDSICAPAQNSPILPQILPAPHATERGMQNENMGVVNNARPFKCPVCGKTFAKTAILKRHHLAHFRPYDCHLCTRSFTRREVLSEHVQEHKGADLRMPCPVCNTNIKRKRNLQAHIKVKHPDYYSQQVAEKLSLR